MYLIPECNLAPLQEKIAKLSKRAAKLNLIPPTIEIIGQKDVETDGIITRVFTIELVGEAPTIPGWKLVAVVEHGDTEVGNVLRTVPNMICPTEYRQANNQCDHCGYIRKRLETFILINDKKQYKQVGRNCLADFCRQASAAEALCLWAEMYSSIGDLLTCATDSEFFGMGRTIPYVATETVLSLTGRVIDVFGWMSKTKAWQSSNPSTASIISRILFERKLKENCPELYNVGKTISEKNRTDADNALEWIRAMRPQAESLNDYLYNCLVIASGETAQEKHFGILCSILPSYKRTLEKQGKEYIGTIGKRERFALTVQSIRMFQFKTMVSMYDDKGNAVIWWATNPPKEFQEGAKVNVKATVKNHSEYQGGKQTTISRTVIDHKGIDQ